MDVFESNVSVEDLDGLPGSPFTQAAIDAAVGAVRAACGWHIAPVRVSTVTVVDGSSLVLLPSLRVSAVVAVRDVSDPERPRLLSGWRHVDGRLYLRGRPPRFVEVEFVHGFDVFPADLLGTVASLAGVVKQGGRITAESLSGHSVSIDASVAGSAVQDPILARYTVPFGVVSA